MALTMCIVLNPSVGEQIAVFGLPMGLSDEVFIIFFSVLSSFSDGPPDEWQSSAHVSAAEDPRYKAFKYDVVHAG